MERRRGRAAGPPQWRRRRDGRGRRGLGGLSESFFRLNIVNKTPSPFDTRPRTDAAAADSEHPDPGPGSPAGRSGPPASDSKARPTARARALPGIAESTSVSAAHLRRARAGHESESFHRPGSESRVISHVARARSAAAVTVADVTQASSMSTVAVTVTTESGTGTQARGLPGNGLAVRLSRNRRTAAAAVRADSEAALGRIRQRAESP